MHARWPRPSRKMQRTKFPRQFAKAVRRCRQHGLFLLAETDDRGKERWIVFCTQTGQQLAVFYPESSRLLVGQDSIRCQGWWQAVEATIRRKALLAARREANGTAGRSAQSQKHHDPPRKPPSGTQCDSPSRT